MPNYLVRGLNRTTQQVGDIIIETPMTGDITIIRTDFQSSEVEEEFFNQMSRKRVSDPQMHTTTFLVVPSDVEIIFVRPISI